MVERVRPKSQGRATHGPLTLRLGLCDEDALRILLATLAALDRGDVLMVWHLLNARTPNQIAKAEGLTRQALHARIRPRRAIRADAPNARGSGVRHGRRPRHRPRRRQR